MQSKTASATILFGCRLEFFRSVNHCDVEHTTSSNTLYIAMSKGYSVTRRHYHMETFSVLPGWMNMGVIMSAARRTVALLSGATSALQGRKAEGEYIRILYIGDV